MMFSNDRNELRRFFQDCWKLKQSGMTLDALQQMIAAVIEQHPEYHDLLETADNLDRDYDPAQGETNPFLHMSMHIALIEQISTNRPDGIRHCHQQLTRALGSAHAAEHAMMACLSEAIWQAQRNNTVPDEFAYLDCLKNLAENN
ncbi:MAG: DUF1841 family protein [Gammaproteobacteria bacterium]|jgi:hypothetical protein